MDDMITDPLVIAIVNAVDPQFALIDNSLDKLLGVSHGYSVAKAYTLAVASKLAYEEVSIIKHELEKDGFDVANSFLPLAYKVILTTRFCFILYQRFMTIS